MKRTFCAALSCAALAMSLDAAAAPRPDRSKLDPALRHAVDRPDDIDWVEVIVQSGTPALADLRARLQGRGGQILGEQPDLGALIVRLRARDLPALEADAAVAHVSADALVHAEAEADGAFGGATSARGLFQTLGLSATAMSGKGVGVAVLDSGIEPSADLVPEAFYDFTRGGNRAAAYDDYGHGTHVSGLIAGRSVGIAASVRLVSLKVLDGRGQGRVSTVVQAIDFVIANRRRLRLDIVNLSLGHPATEAPADDPLVQAVERATRAGLIVVTSAGNTHVPGTDPATPTGEINSPGTAPSAITVGALDTRATSTRRDDTIAEFSSRAVLAASDGQKPDVIAPGVNLVSNAAAGSYLYSQYPQRRVNDDKGTPRLFRLSGTSMAAAVTSGVIALLIEQNRRTSAVALTPNLVKAMLQFSALAIPGETAPGAAGALNAAGALELAASIDMATAVGEWSSRQVATPITTIGGEHYVWSQTVIWGTTIIWGTSVYVNEPAWSPATVWGQTVIWGTAIVH